VFSRRHVLAAEGWSTPSAVGAIRGRRRCRATLSGVPRLDELDLGLALSSKEEAERLTMAQQRLLHLRLTLGGQIGGEIGPPICIVLEGWDAGGKGGCIRRLVEPLDPRHVRVTQISAPTYDEKRHHFLWRFWPKLPGWGGMTIFDRSWYGRVLVERVEEFASVEQWSRAYDEIVEFERTLCAEGMILVKFWLHISDEEQQRRFERRARDPLKRWKLTNEDQRNRARRPDYEAAVEDMLARTDHPAASWVVVPAESKRYARVQVLEETCRVLEEGMASWGIEFPMLDISPEDDG
jgi:polyphosphate kinase 2 (PPK2 family)